VPALWLLPLLGSAWEGDLGEEKRKKKKSKKK
jgi:hypothetical protein